MKIKDISPLNLGISALSMVPVTYAALYAQKISGEEQITQTAIKLVRKGIWWGIIIFVIGMYMEAFYHKGLPLRGFILKVYIAAAISLYHYPILMGFLSILLPLYDLVYLSKKTTKTIIYFSLTGSAIILLSSFATREIVAFQMIATGSALLLLSHLILIPPLTEEAHIDSENTICIVKHMLSSSWLLPWTVLVPIAFLVDITPPQWKPFITNLWNASLIFFLAYIILVSIYLTIYSHRPGFYILLGLATFLTGAIYKILLSGNSLIAISIAILGISLIYTGMKMLSNITSKYILVSSDILGGGLLLLSIRWMFLQGDLLSNMLSQMPMETMFTSAILNMVGIGMVISGLINMGEKLPTPAKGGSKYA